LNDLHAHAAKLAGAKSAVSTDAHSIDAFQCMRFGIDQARRVWLTANDVLNTRANCRITQAAETVKALSREA
jgi:DNA polymerase (family 10)